MAPPRRSRSMRRRSAIVRHPGGSVESGFASQPKSALTRRARAAIMNGMGSTTPLSRPAAEAAPARLVARESELDAIRTRLASGQPGQAVMLEGAPGVGKTSLMEQSIAEARERGVRVLVARGSGAEAEFPFAALIDLFDGGHERGAGDGPGAAAARARGRALPCRTHRRAARAAGDLARRPLRTPRARRARPARSSRSTTCSGWISGRARPSCTPRAGSAPKPSGSCSAGGPGGVPSWSDRSPSSVCTGCRSATLSLGATRQLLATQAGTPAAPPRAAAGLRRDDGQPALRPGGRPDPGLPRPRLPRRGDPPARRRRGPAGLAGRGPRRRRTSRAARAGARGRPPGDPAARAGRSAAAGAGDRGRGGHRRRRAGPARAPPPRRGGTPACVRRGAARPAPPARRAGGRRGAPRAAPRPGDGRPPTRSSPPGSRRRPTAPRREERPGSASTWPRTPGASRRPTSRRTTACWPWPRTSTTPASGSG